MSRRQTPEQMLISGVRLEAHGHVHILDPLYGCSKMCSGHLHGTAASFCGGSAYMSLVAMLQDIALVSVSPLANVTVSHAKHSSLLLSACSKGMRLVRLAARQGITYQAIFSIRIDHILACQLKGKTVQQVCRSDMMFALARRGPSLAIRHRACSSGCWHVLLSS